MKFLRQALGSIHDKLGAGEKGVAVWSLLWPLGLPIPALFLVLIMRACG